MTIAILIGIALAAMGGAYAFGGELGATGMALGLGAGTFGAVALAASTWMVGRLMAAQATPKTGTTIILLAAFVKYPLMIAAWYSARRFGGAAETAFVTGIVLVYFALVGWAATRNAANP